MARSSSPMLGAPTSDVGGFRDPFCLRPLAERRRLRLRVARRRVPGARRLGVDRRRACFPGQCDCAGLPRRPRLRAWSWLGFSVAAGSWHVLAWGQMYRRLSEEVRAAGLAGLSALRNGVFQSRPPTRLLSISHSTSGLSLASYSMSVSTSPTARAPRA
jgi:hypothetical protein